ncbi:DUF4329 domain-containing protein [Endozoicomonadaceae bacterium StTr2]
MGLSRLSAGHYISAITVLCLLCYLPLAIGQQTPDCSPAVLNHEDYYRSEQEAVLAAVNQYNPLSVRQDKEYMGAVFTTEVFGRTWFQFNVAAGSAHRDRIRICFNMPENHELTAFWHTHGAAGATRGYLRSYFSEQDTQLVQETGKPFYLATPDGKLKIFRPGMTTLNAYKAKQLGLGRRTGMATGEQVINDKGQNLKIRVRSDSDEQN